MLYRAKYGIGVLIVMALCSTALAADPDEAREAGLAAKSGNSGMAMLSAGFGAGLVVLGGALGISLIGSRVSEAIARQPEAAGAMFMPWLLTAAMIEGATLFGLLICFLIQSAANNL